MVRSSLSRLKQKKFKLEMFGSMTISTKSELDSDRSRNKVGFMSWAGLGLGRNMKCPAWPRIHLDPFIPNVPIYTQINHAGKVLSIWTILARSFLFTICCNFYHDKVQQARKAWAGSSQKSPNWAGSAQLTKKLKIWARLCLSWKVSWISKHILTWTQKEVGFLS